MSVLLDHLGKLLLLGPFSRPDGGIGAEVEVFLKESSNVDGVRRGKVLVGNCVNGLGFGVAQWATNSSDEFGEADNTIIVLVEVLEHTFEFTWAEDNAGLL